MFTGKNNIIENNATDAYIFNYACLQVLVNNNLTITLHGKAAVLLHITIQKHVKKYIQNIQTCAHYRQGGLTIMFIGA